ncbi:ABC transporter ATP-binding protein [Ilumatobacter sp.]|uniref:ABC transporter ATP-binding protein n=1 Tax=Ilumatobacter sp. TaxID=1967498 RepID=UPI003C77EE4C
MLKVEDLTVEFSTPAGNLRAVDGVTLELAEGETYAIVGESGSGKSVFSRTLINLLAGNGTRGGTIEIGGRDIDTLSKGEAKHFFGVDVAMVFQDPMTSLNPVKRIDAQLMEAMRYHLKVSKSEAKERAIALLKQVHIPSPEQRMRQYPHELSGGMRQRVVIAMALACEPRLLIADEPTTALDVTVQKSILDLLDELRIERKMSMILVTHDLGVARGRADRVGVMYAGRLMEVGATADLFADMRHPYTQALLQSIPNPAMRSHSRLQPIPGRPPNLLDPPQGCAFAARCRHAQPDCLNSKPDLDDSSGRTEGHRWACFHPVGTPDGDAALKANLDAGENAAGLAMEEIVGELV